MRKPEVESPSPQVRVKGGDPMKELLALHPKELSEGAQTSNEKPAVAVEAPAQNSPVAEVEKSKPAEKPEGSKVAAVEAMPAPVEPGQSAVAEKTALPVKPADKTDPSALASSAAPGAPVVAPLATAAPLSPAVQTPPAPAPAPLPPTAVKPAEGLDTIRQDTALAERVTELAGLLRHLNAQVNRVEAAQQKLAASTEESVANLQRRIAMEESSKQIEAAKLAEDPRRAETVAVTAPKERKAPVVLRTGPAPVEAAVEKRAYRIQAASPSLAMLGAGANERPLEVSPGSDIPGWGRVQKIEQRGQSWVVQTSGGDIK